VDGKLPLLKTQLIEASFFEILKAVGFEYSLLIETQMSNFNCIRSFAHASFCILLILDGG
jgi:hypothetical protein